MKTKWLSVLGFGLTVVVLGLAMQSPAAKGGIPGAPGGEDPPPDPEPGLPFTYQRIDVERPDVPYDSTITLTSINDYGVIAGGCTLKTIPMTYFVGYSIRFEPEITADGIRYSSDTNDAFQIEYDAGFDIPPQYINNWNQIAGLTLFSYDSEVSPYGYFDAAVWTEDYIETDLGVSPAGTYGRSHAINDDGLVVVSTYDVPGNRLASNVVVPDNSAQRAGAAYVFTGFGSEASAIITDCASVPSGFRLEWIPVAGWDSVVKCSTDLAFMPFTDLSAPLPYPVNSYTDTVSNGKCFYRVDLQP